MYYGVYMVCKDKHKAQAVLRPNTYAKQAYATLRYSKIASPQFFGLNAASV